MILESLILLSVNLSAATASPSVQQAHLAGVLLPAGTPVRLVTAESIDSRSVKQGQRFNLTIAENVTVSSRILIPVGTPAVGEVEAVSGKGMLGKAAKLILRPLFVDVSGERVNLVGLIKQKGKDATAGAVVTTVLVGALGLLITGKSVTVPSGSIMLGQVRNDVALPVTTP